MFASFLSLPDQGTPAAPTVWFRSRSIIGALLLALAILALQGCSTLGVVYHRADELTYWWLDRYFDWDDPQSTLLRRGLAGLHDWHRRTELPRYADVLDGWANEAGGSFTPTQVCAAAQQARDAWVMLLEHAQPDVVALLATLKPDQLEAMRRRMERNRRDWQSEWLEPAPSARRDRRMRLWQDRLEHFYGSLQPPQQQILREHMRASVFDPARSDAIVARRQLDQQQTLRRLLKQPREGASDAAAMRALLARSMDAPEAADRAYQQQLLQEGCALVAAVQASATPEQRAHLARTLREYATLARSLATAP